MRGRFVELGHFDKNIVKSIRKRGTAGKRFRVFLPIDTLKTTFSVKNLTQRWTESGLFFEKSGHFFRFSQSAGEASPLPPSCAPVSVTESISLNMPKYP